MRFSYDGTTTILHTVPTAKITITLLPLSRIASSSFPKNPQQREAHPKRKGKVVGTRQIIVLPEHPEAALSYHGSVPRDSYDLKFPVFLSEKSSSAVDARTSLGVLISLPVSYLEQRGRHASLEIALDETTSRRYKSPLVSGSAFRGSPFDVLSADESG